MSPDLNPDMSPAPAATAATVRALTGALNARDRQAAAALFTPDAVFRPGAAGASFAGPAAITEALFGFLDAHRSGRFETVHQLISADEAFEEWTWAGVTRDGAPAESHGCDYYLVRDGRVALRSTFRKT
jgi:ketosteroid isomerase-like protein